MSNGRGERVQELRLALKMTQEEVAIRAGLDRTVVVKVENGDNAASTYRVRAGLARALGLDIVSLGELLDGSIVVATALRRIRASTGTDG